MSTRTLTPVSVTRGIRAATFAVAVLSTLVVVYYIAKEIIQGIFVPQQFFSYFTVQTALLFFLVEVLKFRMPNHPLLPMARFSVTLYAVMIAPIYWFFVSPPGTWELNNFWVINHLALPIVALMSWLIDPPERPFYSWSVIALAYPLAFAACSFIRASISGWYPYDFLDHRIDGWNPVGMSVGALMVGVLALGLLIILGAQLRNRYRNQ